MSLSATIVATIPSGTNEGKGIVYIDSNGTTESPILDGSDLPVGSWCLCDDGSVICADISSSTSNVLIAKWGATSRQCSGVAEFSFDGMVWTSASTGCSRDGSIHLVFAKDGGQVLYYYRMGSGESAFTLIGTTSIGVSPSTGGVYVSSRTDGDGVCVQVVSSSATNYYYWSKTASSASAIGKMMNVYQSKVGRVIPIYSDSTTYLLDLDTLTNWSSPTFSAQVSERVIGSDFVGLSDDATAVMLDGSGTATWKKYFATDFCATVSSESGALAWLIPEFDDYYQTYSFTAWGSMDFGVTVSEIDSLSMPTSENDYNVIGILLEKVSDTVDYFFTSRTLCNEVP